MDTDKDIKNDYMLWRAEKFSKKEGFFPIFEGFDKYFKKLSPGAISLFLYLGIHSNNRYGMSFHSIETIAEKFNKTPRTITNWMSELIDVGLIERKQHKYNGVSTTYLRPYY